MDGGRYREERDERREVKRREGWTEGGEEKRGMDGGRYREEREIGRRGTEKKRQSKSEKRERERELSRLDR